MSPKYFRAPGEGMPSVLEDALRRTDVASELLFPIDRASWRRGRYRLKWGARHAARSGIGGVRFHAFDPSRPNDSLESDCRHDLLRLIQTVIRLRREPELANVVLSRDSLRSEQVGNASGKRVKFGLYRPEGDRFRDETAAARETHRQIVRAIRKAGFRVEHPKTFDPATGLGGLLDWAAALRLRKRRNLTLAVLTALALLALLLLPWRCDDRFFTSSPTTRSPKIVHPQADPKPADDHGRGLEAFSRGLGGHLGPQRGD